MNFIHRVKLSALAILSLALLMTNITAQAPQKITSIEGITEYRLANGLCVLLFPDQTKQNATVNIVYLVGSRSES